MSRIWGMRACALLGSAALVAAGLIAGAGPASADVLAGGPVIADHEAAASSSGIYRIPFADGTETVVAEGVRTPAVVHDLEAAGGSRVVAAASGWIRAIADEADGGSVRIEHANGEHTTYVGLAAGSASAIWSVGDWIEAGGVLGRTADAPPDAEGEPSVVPSLLWEVVAPPAPGVALTWRADGASENGVPVAARVCGIPGGELVTGEYVALACDHLPPTAVLRGDALLVDEGEPVPLDASASVDPEGEALTYRWDAGPFDLEPVAQPPLTIADDFEGALTLTVFDTVEGLGDAVTRDVVVRNVPPSVDVVAVGADEGGIARVSATVTDPGDDTLSAQIDWGDGRAAQAVTIADLAAGVDRGYGDDGSYSVTVTVVDDDGGVGASAVPLDIVGVDPVVALDVGATVAFPGGDYAVVAAGGGIDASAEATDVGSDDLAFVWSTGADTVFVNDGVSTDPPLSPFGTFPTEASDAVATEFTAPGVETVRVTVTDDDAETADASIPVIVTGAAMPVRGRGWWLHEFSAAGHNEIPPADAATYLEIVQAASGVFSELEPVATPAQAAAVLSPVDGGARADARADLLCAWLQVATGAVRWDSSVTLASGSEAALLDLLADAESRIASPTTSDEELREVADALSLVPAAD